MVAGRSVRIILKVILTLLFFFSRVLAVHCILRIIDKSENTIFRMWKSIDKKHHNKNGKDKSLELRTYSRFLNKLMLTCLLGVLTSVLLLCLPALDLMRFPRWCLCFQIFTAISFTNSSTTYPQCTLSVQVLARLTWIRSVGSWWGSVHLLKQSFV